MITGKELEEIAYKTGNPRQSGVDVNNKPIFRIDFDWQAIANELNQRTCESCSRKNSEECPLNQKEQS